MLREATEEIYGPGEQFLFISLLVAKTRVVIIGGGRAASIAAGETRRLALGQEMSKQILVVSFFEEDPSWGTATCAIT